MANNFPVIRYGRLVQATEKGQKRLFQPDEAERALVQLHDKADEFLSAAQAALIESGGEILAQASAERVLDGHRRSPALGPIYDFAEFYACVNGLAGRVRVGVTVCEDVGVEQKGAYSKIWVRFRLIGVDDELAQSLDRPTLLRAQEQAERIAEAIIEKQLPLYRAALRTAAAGDKDFGVELQGQPIVIVAISQDTSEFDALHAALRSGKSLRELHGLSKTADALYNLIPLAERDWKETPLTDLIAKRRDGSGPTLHAFENVRLFRGYFWKSSSEDGPRRYVGFARSPFVAPDQEPPKNLPLPKDEEGLRQIEKQDAAAVTVSAVLASELGGQDITQ